MSSSEPVMFPCPKCGAGRGKIGLSCKQCGWDLEAGNDSMKPKSEPYSKFAAMFVGLLTLAPIAYIIYFLAVMMIAVSGAESLHLGSFRFLILMHVSVMVLTWCLIGFYIYYLFKTDHVRQDQKALWAVALILGNTLAMPVFWYLYIWKPAADAM